MASGNITLGAIAATLETGSIQYVATLSGITALITNTGSVDVEIGWNGQAITIAGVQGVGQATLKVGQSMPTEMMSSFSFMSANAGLIVYLPVRRRQRASLASYTLAALDVTRYA